MAVRLREVFNVAKSKTKFTEAESVKRSVNLQSAFKRYLLEQPELHDKLPPDLTADNLELPARHPAQGRPVSLVRMKVGRKIEIKKLRPAVHLPLAA